MLCHPTAFIDESLRQQPTGLYVVAAVVVTDDIEQARTAVRSMLLRRQPRFHWRAESEAQRLKMLDLVTTVSDQAMAYTCERMPDSKQARARVQCLKRLLWDLGATSINRLVFESRDERNDRKDRQTIMRAQQARAAPTTLSYEFRRPHDEPLLWLADAVAGAVATDTAGRVTRYVDILGDRLATTEVRP